MQIIKMGVKYIVLYLSKSIQMAKRKYARND